MFPIVLTKSKKAAYRFMPVQRLLVIYRVVQLLKTIHSITLKLTAQYNGNDRLSMCNDVDKSEVKQ